MKNTGRIFGLCIVVLIAVLAAVPAQELQIDSSMFYRQSWAVVIGINEYPNFPSLDYAVNDARAIGARFKRLGFHVITLENERATKQNILDLLQFELPSVVEPDDRLVIFYSGHGAAGKVARTGGEVGFIIPQDGKNVVDGQRLNIVGGIVQIRDSDYATFARKANFISTEEIRKVFDMLPAKHILSIFDGCYSGFIDPTSYTRLQGSTRIDQTAGVGTGRGFDDIVSEIPEIPELTQNQEVAVRPTPLANDILGGIHKLTSLQTIQILTAGSSGEQVFERSGHGIFTYHLLKALDGAAKLTEKSCVITASDLGAYLKQNVLKASSNAQNPLFNRIGGEGEYVFITPECRPILPVEMMEPTPDPRWVETDGYKGPQALPYREPTQVAVDEVGALYVLDSKLRRILRFDAQGRFYPKFTEGTIVEEPWQPHSIAVAQDGHVWVFYSWQGTAWGNETIPTGKVMIYRPDGTPLPRWNALTTPVSGCFDKDGAKVPFPVKGLITLDIEESIIVLDQEQGTLMKCDRDGKLLHRWGEEREFYEDYKRVVQPQGLAVDNLGYIYVSNTGAHGIQKFFNEEWIPGWLNPYVSDSDPYFFNTPQGIAVDEKLFVYVADSKNHRVKKYTSNGDKLLTTWGKAKARSGRKYGEFNRPADVTVSPEGFIYVADTGNKRVQRFVIMRPPE